MLHLGPTAPASCGNSVSNPELVMSLTECRPEGVYHVVGLLHLAALDGHELAENLVLLAGTSSWQVYLSGRASET